jgi:2-succinyl-6-hydroxy-2,4-cyclohexadiene-1-carboxylate synthase
MPIYNSPDAAIYYEIEGQGPPLILLHGYALNSLMWELQKPEFIKSHQVISVDLRGFGKSSCGERWSGAAMSEDVTGLIKSLGIRDVTILGFSMSGPVAIRVALQTPELVSRLILAASILPSAGRSKTPSEEKHQENELRILRERGIEGWARAMGMYEGRLVEKMFRINPDLRRLWQRIFERHNQDYLLSMLTSRLQTLSPVNWRSRLGEICQKTLIISGELDINFIDASHFMAAEIPNVEYVIIERAGHMVNLEAPEAFAAAVLKFLNA